MSWLTTISAPFVGREEPHQPLLRVDVEVVRRLVEQQQVGPAEQDARELQPPPLAARQRASPAARAGPGRARARPRSCRPRTPPGSRRASRYSSSSRANRATCRSLVGLLERDPGLLEPAREVDQRRAPPRMCSRPRVLVLGRMLARVLAEVADRARGGSRARPPAGSSPARTRSVLVLPAPLRPTTPTLSPARRSNESPRRRRPAGLDGEVADLERAHRRPPTVVRTRRRSVASGGSMRSGLSMDGTSAKRWGDRWTHGHGALKQGAMCTRESR